VFATLTMSAAGAMPGPSRASLRKEGANLDHSSLSAPGAGQQRENNSRLRRNSSRILRGGGAKRCWNMHMEQNIPMSLTDIVLVFLPVAAFRELR